MPRNLDSCQRIVIKAGTTTLTSRDGNFSIRALEKLGHQVLSVVQSKKETVLVSSGAIARGMEVCGFKHRPKKMSGLQACAAIGQGKLMHDYERFFSKRGRHTAQLLLTRDGLEHRDRFLKARHTFEELFTTGILPIVNENDTVATDEIKFGDNDVLSVQVAHLVRADLVILMSDVDGFHLKDGTRIREVASEEEIDQELVRHLRDKVKAQNVGGMKAKLEAARIAMRLGIPLLIVDGKQKEVIADALSGKDVGTIFLPGKNARNERKKWIAFSAARKGRITIDAGASQALCRHHRSLLASGVSRVQGIFTRGQVVEIEDAQGKVLGRGIVRYNYQELTSIMGKKSADAQIVLGDKFQSAEIIHRNDLVLWA
ncbi:MAG: glutamate 5-kinase [Candidatus Omnitrophica bacterium]|nr:glutamate 5-kinase [Candidatus Omnitrophota bacterium]